MTSSREEVLEELEALKEQLKQFKSLILEVREIDPSFLPRLREVAREVSVKIEILSTSLFALDGPPPQTF